MPQITRTGSKALEVMATSLKELDGWQGKAGWFESAKYADGTPAAYIASIQEFGASINHPGGTPYFVTSDGSAHFVKKNTAFSFGLPQTKAHKIVIPPRPFMRPTIERDSGKWAATMAQGALAVLKGKRSPFDVFEGVGRMAADGIAKSISLVASPPLKRSTIMARLRKLRSKEVTASLEKPLVASGFLLQRVDNITQKVNE